MLVKNQYPAFQWAWRARLSTPCTLAYTTFPGLFIWNCRTTSTVLFWKTDTFCLSFLFPRPVCPAVSPVLRCSFVDFESSKWAAITGSRQPPSLTQKSRDNVEVPKCPIHNPSFCIQRALALSCTCGWHCTVMAEDRGASVLFKEFQSPFRCFLDYLSCSVSYPLGSRRPSPRSISPSICLNLQYLRNLLEVSLSGTWSSKPCVVIYIWASSHFCITIDLKFGMFQSNKYNLDPPYCTWEWIKRNSCADVASVHIKTCRWKYKDSLRV